MVESAPLPPGTVRRPADHLREFVHAVFVQLGIPDGDADLIADVLVSADLRGIRSHGVARVPYFHVRLARGVLNIRPSMSFRQGSDTTGLLDADNGVGIVAANRAMTEAIRMAAEHGSGFVAVAHSSHFGYAGYWAEQAMRHGCVGISLSNSGGRTTPTFGVESLLGTNPLSVTIPGGEGNTDFFLDMATSAVAVGKIETALREGRPLGEGWVSTALGEAALDERGVLTYDAPLLPLGGEGDESGGHKGYGLNLMVELLCGVLSGTGLKERLDGASGHAPAGMAQLMGALRIDGFRPLADVQSDMAETFGIVRGAARAPGRDRIFIHGEPEAILMEENKRLGIPITPAVMAQLQRVSEDLGLGAAL
ncbi:MAG: Ldh family oxidoreductase [Acidimicrobiia bacterium]|nr:Ldh family oxidoreductase [Acidimicrobiia bacterium]